MPGPGGGGPRGGGPGGGGPRGPHGPHGPHRRFWHHRGCGCFPSLLMFFLGIAGILAGIVCLIFFVV